jgi:hypothetical protein
MTDVLINEQGTSSPINAFTSIFVVILGTFAGLGGALHAVAEIAQGNEAPVEVLLNSTLGSHRTSGFFALGDSQVWIRGCVSAAASTTC